MNNICLKLAVAMIAGIGLLGTNANAATRMVNCDKGQTIQAAVERGQGSAGQLYIDVSGYCDEVVTIKRDDVSIDGENNATVKGFLVQGGRRISISSLTVTGPGVGIYVVRGDIELTDVDVTGNVDFGLLLNNGSDAAVEESTISGNDIGISVRNGSNVIVNGSDILSNTSTGIETDNGTSVVVYNISAISGNTGGGIDADLHSRVVIRESSVTNNGNYGIKLQSDSGLRIDPNVIVSGNGVAGEFCSSTASCGVFCGDTESSVLDLSDIDDVVECTDFTQVSPTP